MCRNSRAFVSRPSNNRPPAGRRNNMIAIGGKFLLSNWRLAAMTYYKTDSRKISFMEYWHLTPRGFWLAWWHKLMGNQLNLARGIPSPQPLKSRLVDADAIPKPIFEKLNTSVQELRALGFDRLWYETYAKESLLTGLAYSAIALPASGQIIAKTIFVCVPRREHTTTVFLSDLGAETILATTNKKPAFRPLPNHLVQRKVGAGIPFLLAWHQQKLSALGRERPARVFTDLDDLAAFDDRLVQQTYDDKIQRGIWVEMSDAEVAALRAQKSIARAALPR